MVSSSPERPLRYLSRLYPIDRSRPELFARLLFQPFMITLSAVMILSLSTVLLGYPVLTFALRGTILAFVASAAWTYFRVSQDVVELRFEADRVAVITAWKAVAPSPRLAWERALDVRRTDAGIAATIGHTTYDFSRHNWPDLPEITEQLRATQP